MKKSVAIIIGGSGQFGVTVAKDLLLKKYKVILTTRNVKKNKFLLKNNKNLYLKHLDIYNKDKIYELIKKSKPNLILYFAGQSSPKKSFYQKNNTYKSNYIGCKNVLEVIWENKINCKFLNAASCEIFGKIKGKINFNSPMKPVSPYGVAKLASFKITKFYREKYKLKNYNAIIFNTESYLRNRDYLIPKICLAAINAKKNQIITEFGNLKVAREWNWCSEQSKFLIKFLNKKPQDFTLSNGKSYTVIQMLEYAFGYFKLDYKKYISINKKFLRKKDILHKKSNYLKCLKRNNLKRKPIVYGKKIIELLIKYYLNEKKH
jgi:GDPmannose 4,6-dehydratase